MRVICVQTNKQVNFRCELLMDGRTCTLPLIRCSLRVVHSLVCHAEAQEQHRGGGPPPDLQCLSGFTMNAGMINQESGRVADGLKHVEAVLERNQLALGAEHTQVALSPPTVAVA